MGYSYTTAKTYVAGINHELKINNLTSYNSFLIEKMLIGMQRLGKKEDSRKPITLQILSRLVSVLHHVCDSFYETQLFVSAFCLSFFGFLRIGEIAYVGKSSDYHVLDISDVVLDEKTCEVSVKIKSSKTDQMGRSTTLILQKFIDEKICVFKHLKAYLEVRPSIDGQLFCHLNHKKLTRFQFSKILKSALTFLGLNPDDFNTHSFRIGAATTACMEGKSDEDIKFMGRWDSNSYKTYIRMGRLVKF